MSAIITKGGQWREVNSPNWGGHVMARTIKLEGGDMITADIDEVIDLMNQKVIETQINDLKKYTIKGYIPDNIASVTMTVLQAQLKHNKKGDSNDKS